MQNTANSALSNANTANSKIDGLEIGGRNLLLKSDLSDISIISVHVGSNNTSTESIVSDDSSPSKKAIKISKTNNSGTTSSNGGRYYKLKEKLVVGKEYTWSISVKGTGTITIGSEQGGYKYIALTEEYQKITHTFTAANKDNYQFVFYGNGDFDLTFHSIKLESGNKASAWTSAPEDVESTIENVNTKVTTVENKQATLEQNLNGFKTTVSNTYSTKTELNTLNGTVTSIQQRVNTVEQSITATSITTTISSAINAGTSSISTTQFVMDNTGFTVKNGAIKVQNKVGETVMTSDSNGNLVIQSSITTGGLNNKYGTIKLLDEQSRATLYGSKDGLKATKIDFYKDYVFDSSGSINDMEASTSIGWEGLYQSNNYGLNPSWASIIQIKDGIFSSWNNSTPSLAVEIKDGQFNGDIFISSGYTLGTHGYNKLTNGMIEQWRVVNITGQASNAWCTGWSIQYPKIFPNAIVNLDIQILSDGNAYDADLRVIPYLTENTNTFQYHCKVGANGTLKFRWRALGY